MSINQERYYKNRTKEKIEKRLYGMAQARGRALVISGPNACRHHKNLKRITNNYNNGITFVDRDRDVIESIQRWKYRSNRNNRKITIIHDDIANIDCEPYNFVDLDLMGTIQFQYKCIENAFAQQFENWESIKTFMFTICSRHTEEIVPYIRNLLSWIGTDLRGFDGKFLTYKKVSGNHHYPDIADWGDRLRYLELITYKEKLNAAPMATVFINYK